MVGAGRVLVLLAACLVFPAGCSSNPNSAPGSPSPPVVTFVANDYSFGGPDTLPAGASTLRMHNEGRELHQIQFVKLGEGKNMEDLAKALSAVPTQIPPWALQMGGPNAVNAGGVSEAEINLPPGFYAVICLVPSHSGTAHAALGMVKAVRVARSDAPVQRTPSDYHLAMREFEIVVVEPIKKGKHTFQVRNQGTQPHQVSLVKLDGGRSAMDVAAAFTPSASMPIPGQVAGGITGLEPGGEGTFTATLSEGRYALMCLFPNPSSPDNHAAKGMVMNFTVK
jgi:hypothetical protein